MTHDIAAAGSVADTLWQLGRIRDEKAGSNGAPIVHRVDLMQRGLAWHPDVSHAPASDETTRDVEARFASL